MFSLVDLLVALLRAGLALKRDDCIVVLALKKTVLIQQMFKVTSFCLTLARNRFIH